MPHSFPKLLFAFASISALVIPLAAQPAPPSSSATAKPEDTEVWDPVPKVVTPGADSTKRPSDAIALFDGTSVNEWVMNSDKSPANWEISDGDMVVSTAKDTGNIETKRKFRNYQLHIEWKIPATVTGTGQLRGNSGIFLASTGPGDDGYELQILDSHGNKTYSNGQAGSIYKQAIPLANPSRAAGEWQTYDIIWMAPVFQSDGSLKTPASVTVFFNGVLVENHFELQGETRYIGKPFYKQYDSAPIKLQAHGKPPEPIRFRNIWVRELN